MSAAIPLKSLIDSMDGALRGRRRDQCASMFRRIVSDQSRVLRYLLPTKRDSPLTDKLRSAKS